MANDRILVDCTSVVLVADDDAVAVDVIADDADGRECPLDGSLAGVTRGTCCSADDNCRLTKLLKQEVWVLDEDASGQSWRNAL